MNRYLVGAALFAVAASASAEPLHVYNGRLFITAKVNDVATEALLDSGRRRPLSIQRWRPRRNSPPGHRR